MTPSEASIQLQAMPAATSGTTCGRNNTTRPAELIRRDATRRITLATIRPSTTGMPVK